MLFSGWKMWTKLAIVSTSVTVWCNFLVIFLNPLWILHLKLNTTAENLPQTNVHKFIFKDRPYPKGPKGPLGCFQCSCGRQRKACLFVTAVWVDDVVFNLLLHLPLWPWQPQNLHCGKKDVGASLILLVCQVEHTATAVLRHLKDVEMWLSV